MKLVIVTAVEEFQNDDEIIFLKEICRDLHSGTQIGQTTSGP